MKHPWSKVIDLAFKSKPRTSKLFTRQELEDMLFERIKSNNLGVVGIEEPSGGRLQVTNIERTLVIALQPFILAGQGKSKKLI